MERQAFIQQIEDLIGLEVDNVQWIYGLGEDVGDSGALYPVDATLQVIFKDRGEGFKRFVSFGADNYCDDRDSCVMTLLGVFEESNANLDDVPYNVDIDRVVELLRDYFYNYADTLDKPELDSVYYESM